MTEKSSRSLEMMTSMAATVFDRQQALMKWQQLQQQSSSSYFNNNQLFAGYLGDDCSNKHNDINGSQILASQANAWPDLAIGSYHVVEDMARSGGVSSPKRKSDEVAAAKMGIGPTDENKRVMKKAKKDEMAEAEVQIQQTSNEEGEGKSAKGTSRKANSKEVTTQPEKTDYIHVRARRGQATDSHSLAERVRREKISERMKYLQDLVPGCNKITGKAGMLDEIINYVQSLQRQVEFLSMKLAAAHPRLDFSMDQLFNKEINPACSGGIPTIGMPSEGGDPSYLQFNPMGDAMACCGLDTTMNPSELALRRAASTLVPVHDSSVDTSLNVHGSWENEMQNLCNLEFHQGRGLPFPFQLFQGIMMPNNPKMEL